MQFSSKLTMATHLLLAVDYFNGKEKTTSDFLASSIGTSPVVVRRLLSQLQKTNLVEVEAGVGGTVLAQSPYQITLLDIYNAVEKPEEFLFHFHENPNEKCPVGRNIHVVMDKTLEDVTKKMEEELASVRLSDLEKKLHQAMEIQP